MLITYKLSIKDFQIKYLIKIFDLININYDKTKIGKIKVLAQNIYK